MSSGASGEITLICTSLSLAASILPAVLCSATELISSCCRSTGILKCCVPLIEGGGRRRGFMVIELRHWRCIFHLGRAGKWRLKVSHSATWQFMNGCYLLVWGFFSLWQQLYHFFSDMLRRCRVTDWNRNCTHLLPTTQEFHGWKEFYPTDAYVFKC